MFLHALVLLPRHVTKSHNFCCSAMYTCCTTNGPASIHGHSQQERLAGAAGVHLSQALKSAHAVCSLPRKGHRSFQGAHLSRRNCPAPNDASTWPNPQTARHRKPMPKPSRVPSLLRRAGGAEVTTTPEMRTLQGARLATGTANSQFSSTPSSPSLDRQPKSVRSWKVQLLRVCIPTPCRAGGAQQQGAHLADGQLRGGAAAGVARVFGGAAAGPGPLSRGSVRRDHQARQQNGIPAAGQVLLRGQGHP